MIYIKKSVSTLGGKAKVSCTEGQGVNAIGLAAPSVNTPEPKYRR